MTIRQLPQIDAPQMPRALRWDVADSAAKCFTQTQARGRDESENVISMYGAIGEDIFSEGGVTAKRISAALRSIKSEDIVVSINSPGGDFFEGVAIYNMLKQDKRKVTVEVVGLAASAASIIAMAGDEVRIAESALMMIHNAWGVVVGNAKDMRDTADVFSRFDESMAGIYAKRGNMTEDEARAMMENETWFTSRGAVESGLADSLMDDYDEKDNTRSALRAVESALAAQGMSRSERRRIISEMTGKPSAADQATPSAGESNVNEAFNAALADLLTSLKGDSK